MNHMNSADGDQTVVEEKPQTVYELLNKLKSEHAVVKSRKDYYNGRLMKGRTQYKLLGKQELQKMYQQRMQQEQSKFLDGLTGGEQNFGGII